MYDTNRIISDVLCEPLYKWFNCDKLTLLVTALTAVTTCKNSQLLKFLQNVEIFRNYHVYVFFPIIATTKILEIIYIIDNTDTMRIVLRVRMRMLTIRNSIVVHIWCSDHRRISIDDVIPVVSMLIRVTYNSFNSFNDINKLSRVNNMAETTVSRWREEIDFKNSNNFNNWEFLQVVHLSHVEQV